MSESIDITLDGLRALKARLAQHSIEPGDWTVVAALVNNLLEREETKLARKIAKIKAEQAAAAAATAPDAGGNPRADSSGADDNGGEDDDSQVDAGPEELGGDGAAPSGDDPSTPTRSAPEGGAGQDATDPPKPKHPGHGKNGSAAYTNATHVYHLLAHGIIGSLCDKCGTPLTRYRDKIIIRIVGQPMFCAEAHHFEQARCRLCGKIVRAEVPADVTAGIGSSYVNYHWTACALLPVLHYFGGMPFKRLESLHAGWGIPLADANQWDVVNEGDRLIMALFKAYEDYAIQNGTSVRIDDTGSKVISLQQEINAEIKALEAEGKSIGEVRKGINATGVYVETPEGTITLYYTGRHHAGEILGRMLDKRRAAGATEKLVKVTDAANKNFDAEYKDELVEGACNAHALLNFRDIKTNHPEEYALAGEVYSKVYDNEDETKARGMTPDERMRYHRAHSLPLLAELKRMCEDKITSRLVEPRSKLWKPLTFIINQWKRLTLFCHEPGVPLDSNLVEQSLIIPVRYLAASFNYHTINGADVGDHFMSYVVTAMENDVEPVAYLADCLENHEDLAKRPAEYLPWAWRDRQDDELIELPTVQ